MSAHTCHWPGCTVEVPPRLWGCKPHWFRLPKELRDEIWHTYVPGQEITKKPSAEYVAVARRVQEWCVAQIAAEPKPNAVCQSCRQWRPGVRLVNTDGRGKSMLLCAECARSATMQPRQRSLFK